MPCRRSDAIFHRMKRIPILLCALALSAAFLLVGCSSGGFQDEQDHTHHSGSAKLDLHPEGDSGVRGTVSFEDTAGDVLVELDLRNLPKPETFYLTHIHPGTCALEEEAEEHHEEGYGQEHGEEIEYPLSQVKSDSEGRGSSTTTLRDTSIENLFSGEPKHVNVHAVGSGNPPVLACANLNSQARPPVKTVKEPTTPETAPLTPKPTSSDSAGGMSGEEQAAHSEADCRIVIYVAQENMSRQEAKAFSELLADMIRTMENPSWTTGPLRNAALDHLGVPRYAECKVGGE